MTVRILTGDCRDVLRTLPDESVHTVVTSPPYWGLRDYGVDGQLGLETSLGEHVATMVEVFREVRRVLRKDGTLWLNYGDSYAASPNGRSAADTKAAGRDDRTFRDKPFSTVGPIGRLATWDRKSERNGHNLSADDDTVPNRRVMPSGVLKPKDLCGIPWRVAFALQEDGWYLRQDIIWSKPNPMPESVRDRCTKAHEYLFLLAKSERYYFDAEAIAEPLAEASVERLNQPTLSQQLGSYRVPGKTNGPMKAVVKSGTYSEDSGRFDGNPHPSGGYVTGSATRNKRSVWEVTTQPFPDAHFATFPPALIEPCILAGCPSKCCAKCGAPHVLMVKRTAPNGKEAVVLASDRFAACSDGTPLMGDNAYTPDKLVRGSFNAKNGVLRSEPIGLRPSCQCNADTVPGTCLDPFGGAGTTALVADRLQRSAILIELNPTYADMARNRIVGDAPLFVEAAQ